MAHREDGRTEGWLVVAAGGAGLMLACAFAAFIASWLFFTEWPNAVPGRLSFVIPFAPLTSLAILVVGTLYSRRWKPARAQSIGALLIVEVCVWCAVAYAAGTFDIGYVLLFWLPLNLLFMPWWLLATWLGNRLDMNDGL